MGWTEIRFVLPVLGGALETKYPVAKLELSRSGGQGKKTLTWGAKRPPVTACEAFRETLRWRRFDLLRGGLQVSDEGETRGGPDTVWVATGQYLGYGLTWALSTLLFLWGGWELDKRVGTIPLFTILGAFLGAGAGFYRLYYHVVVEPNRPDDGEDA